MNLNELLHIEQVHLMLRKDATSPAEIVAHGRKLANVALRLSTLPYKHRPYGGTPAGVA